ncbi:MAG: LTA synthase family protein [Burkholderiales bacterium]
MPQATLGFPGRALVRIGRVSPRVMLVWLLALTYATTSLATRLGLLVKALATDQMAFAEVPRVLAAGFAYDFVTTLYVVVLSALYFAFVPARVFARRTHWLLVHAGFALWIFGAIYLGVVEYFFFDEFNARFNFVAVEYLIYPHEVFVNIWESYPVAQALAAATLVTAGLAWLAKPLFAQLARQPDQPQRARLLLIVLLSALALAHSAVNLDSWRQHGNRVADEVAANGVYSFFNAAVNSRLDYPEFYTTVPDPEAADRVRRMAAQDNATFIAGAANPLARRVVYAAPPKLLNVIVLLQESLGADYVGAYGDTRGLTPNIDALARQSVVFTQTYATGTRTVRGMEAVTASFPPVPAESIVKRPNNEQMFNWSTVMSRAGYEPTFIYGGYGAFDNMNRFFGTNGYRVIDRTDMPTPRFGNIWGVSDEDLFEHALRVFDEQHRKGERIFSVVMSTSNHKPFTFPAGVPGVPESGGGREAGVRYADHAVGKFIEALRKKPYFDNTAVVIVADHGARVYGKADFPLDSYEIPFLVYAPRHFTPRKIETPTSQIDVAPTVLGLLRISHDSAFFGRDVLAESQLERAIPLNHNRDIALLEGDHLNQLGFRKTALTLTRDPLTNMQRPAPRDEEGLRDAAGLFQVAYRLYASHRYAAQ